MHCLPLQVFCRATLTQMQISLQTVVLENSKTLAIIALLIPPIRQWLDSQAGFFGGEGFFPLRNRLKKL